VFGKLFAHTSLYSIGSLLVTLASFISFPILTRVFSVEEYGIMNLVSVTLMLLIGVAKLGVQHSLVRFYAEIGKGERQATPAQYFSTVLFGMGATGLAASLLWAGLSAVMPASWWSNPQIQGLLLLTAVLVFVRVVDSALVNILRAQQRSAAYSLYTVLRKYIELGAILVTIFFLIPGLLGFYVATIVVELLAIVVLGALIVRRVSVSMQEFDAKLYRAMLAFGIPMIAYEMGGILLNVGDRYVIEFMLGADAVGIYSAAYNVCDYVQMIVIASVGRAIVPMYVHLWEEKGAAETRRFVERSLRLYVLIGAAMVAGVTAVGPELLSVLASEKYRAGHAIMVYVIAGLVIDGAGSIFGAGLYIFKQTRIMMWMVAGCAVLNLVANLLLIPFFGIEGAALATLISYGALGLLIWLLGRKQLPVSFPVVDTLKYAGMALIMYYVVTRVQVPGAVLGLVLKVALGVAVYGVLVLLFDRRARGLLRDVLERWRSA
jgi:O-antigen/teichoic acid export membrane protein